MGNATVSTAHEKNKRVVLNIISNLSYEAVKIVFGFVLPRLYLVNFGSDVNGLDSTIKNIFAYLALLEAGAACRRSILSIIRSRSAIPTE